MSKIGSNELDPNFYNTLRDPANLKDGTMGGIIKAKTNTSYSTAQMRNTIISTSDPDLTKMNDGDVWLKIEA
jgi:hypothetical protein